MKFSIISATMMLMATSAIAQHAHQSSLPSETGQSQFAAIAEIVTLLRDDPKTDWGQVDIKALRDHLVDMDNVTTKASVERNFEGQSTTFTVTGDKMVAASIQRMVLAHGSMLQETSHRTVRTQEIETGATMTIVVGSQLEMQQVSGLGFFGLMTIGAHHQQHHLMIATGRSPH